MSSLSQMKFSRKIFLALFGMASFTALVISLILYFTLSKGRKSDFAESYIDHMNLFAKTLAGIEESQQQISKNAAEVVRNMGLLNDTQRQEMAKYLGVDEINFFSSRDELLKTWPKLPDYAGGPASVYQTEMLRGPDGRVGQHSLIQSKDGKRIIEIMVDFDDVTQLLRAMAQHDEDNLAVEIIDSENQSLGRIARPDFQESLPLQEILNWNEGAHWHNDRMIVLTSFSNEGHAKKRLVSTISTRSLQADLQKIQWILLVTCLGLIALSWFVARGMTDLLLNKIQGIHKTLSEITESQNYTLRVPVITRASENELEQLGQNLNKMLETMQSHQSRLLDAERDKAKNQIAAQVAHDIRSPLMSMNMALSQIEGASLEPLALIKSAVARIAGIVQKLSAVTAKVPTESAIENPKLTLVEPLIASVVNEHRVRRDTSQALLVNGLSPMPQAWSVVQVSELQTALSNLINNAFEAGATEVVLNFSTAAKEWTLAIKDNGKGIPTDILEKIFERSFTFGKQTGTGLGLFQAKAAIEWSGGTLEVTSQEGQGTTFTIHMPLEKKPSFVTSSLEASPSQSIYLVDDDKNILETWMGKFKALGFVNIKTYTSAADFMKETVSFPEDGIIIIDQNLGDTPGTQVLSGLNLGRRAYLCTTDFDEKSVQDQIKKLNTYLIPKIWISGFEIKARTS